MSFTVLSDLSKRQSNMLQGKYVIGETGEVSQGQPEDALSASAIDAPAIVDLLETDVRIVCVRCRCGQQN